MWSTAKKIGFQKKNGANANFSIRIKKRANIITSRGDISEREVPRSSISIRNSEIDQSENEYVEIRMERRVKSVNATKNEVQKKKKSASRGVWVDL